MIEAFVIVLREGIEAALVVAILIGALRRADRRDLLARVVQGLVAAVAASFLGAILLRGLAANEDVFEGVLMLVAAVFVATMMWWIHRTAHRLRETVEKQVARAARWGGIAVFWLSFLLVAREGIEAVLFLSAASFSSTTLSELTGGMLGLLLAVAFGVAFVSGSVRVDLRRFFAVTNFVLGILLVQLFVGGFHELAEAGIIPVGPREMALIGPVVKNDVLFILAVLLIPVFLLATAPRSPVVAGEGPEARLARARALRERRGRRVSAAASAVAIVVLAAAFVRGETDRILSPAQPVAVAGGAVRVPAASLLDGKLHRFVADVNGHAARFLLLAVGSDIRAAFDACEICGTKGYNQQGGQIVCLNCDASINAATFGHPGGCNPIPLASRREGGDVVISAADLARKADEFPAAAAPAR